MLFSDNIPDRVLENPNTASFIRIIDLLQEYKQSYIKDIARVHNPLLCTDKKWLIRQLVDLGFPEVSINMPLVVLQQLIINAGKIVSLIGSIKGLELLCNTSTLGTFSYTLTNYPDDINWLFLDSLKYGHITNSTDSDTWMYLVNSNVMTQDSVLTLNLGSKFFSSTYTKEAKAIKEFISSMAKYFLGFKENFSLVINTSVLSNFIYDNELNDYFKN